MSITPVFPRYRYGNEEYGRCPYEISGSTVFGTFSLSSFSTDYPITTVVSGYSSIYEDEVFYILSKDKLFAVLANGPKTGTAITTGSVLWTFSGFHGRTSPNPGYGQGTINFGMVLSEDGETIYCNPFYCSVGRGFHVADPYGTQLFAINTSDGSEKWSYIIKTSDYRDSNTLVSPVVEDNDGNIHILRRFSNSSGSYANYKLYIQKFNPLTGVVDSSQQINSISSNAHTVCFSLLTNAEKDTLFAGYNDTVPRYHSAIVSVDKDYVGVAEITLSTGIDEPIYTKGMAYNFENNNVVYATTNKGLFRVEFGPDTQWLYTGTNPSEISWTSPAIGATNNTVYYRAGSKLYAVNTNGTLKWASSILPNSGAYVSPIIDINDNIIIASRNSDLDPNIHIFSDGGTVPIVEDFFRAGDAAKYIQFNPSLGNQFGITDNIFYVPIYTPSTGKGSIYLLKSSLPPTTTTTTSSTTTTTPTTTTTTTTGTGTTTTTTPTTTTTTTTTPAPLSVVETLIIVDVNGQFVEQSASSASDNNQTKGNLFASSLTFGTIAPGETSENVIVLLNVPNSQAIGNVKLGLVDAGGIEFANDIFGITSENRLDDSVVPSTYFQGVNTSGTASNSNNIAIGNSKSNVSEYVYLNLNLPSGNTLGEGVIRYKWFFDYAD